MNRRALILGVVACLTWSTVFVLGRWAIHGQATDPVVLGLYRFALSGLILAALMAAMGRGRAFGAFRREPVTFLVLGLTGGFAMGLFVFLALECTNSTIVQIIMNSNPVLIVPLSLLIGERVGAGKVAGVALGVVGCALVLWGASPTVALANPHHVLGGALAVLGGLCWALYTVLGRGPVRRHGGLTTTTISMLIGGACFLALCLLLGKSLILSWEGLLVALFLAIVPTVIGFTAWYVALEKLPANVLGPIQFITPVAGVTLAVLWLGEDLTLLMICGGALALAGVYLSTRDRASDAPEGRGAMTQFRCPCVCGYVEMTEERERHIAANHPDLLPGRKRHIMETLAAPDQVRRSSRAGNVRLFSRWFPDLLGGKHVVVVVVSGSGTMARHWIITAYIARKLAEGEAEWTRS